MLPLLGKKNIQSVAFIWGVAFINPKKKIEVHALIRSVAFIRVLLLFGGVTRKLDMRWKRTPAYA